MMLSRRPGASPLRFDNATGHNFFDYDANYGAVPPVPVRTSCICLFTYPELLRLTEYGLL